MPPHKIQEIITAILLLTIFIAVINKYSLIKKTKIFFSHIAKWKKRLFWAWLIIGTLLIQNMNNDVFSDKDEATFQFFFFSTSIFTAYAWVLKAYHEDS